DIFVQTPDATQGLNRYSYAMGNPLAFTDPSGYEVTGGPISSQPHLQELNHQRSMERYDWIESLWRPGLSAEGFHAIMGGASLGEVITPAMLSPIMTILNKAIYNNGKGEDAPSDQYEIRSKDVDWITLWKEFETGTGPERSYFGDGHPMVESMKKSWIVTLAILKFAKDGGDKELKRYDVPFGFVGFILAGTDMTQQFVGGARVTIKPLIGGGYYFQVDDTKDYYSFSYHQKGNVPARTTEISKPYSATYQRYVWIVK
ncbi:MAG: hypothetical protein KKD31_07590, partial [Bacteroidetes bacterium]|nr:hypothetical protein [Bacteroidota bacterium]